MHRNFIILDSELLILLDKFKLLIIVLSFTNVLIYDNSNSDSNYKDKNQVIKADFITRQELKDIAILLRTRI